ncbi:xanthine dehydrogenase family protein molybdopterin-binding subunit [Pleomorphovibrio marinus]|uniref:xanthine dehydrogenase family protein molybdopterin-binding subunit n=1 Tax=Pleomorphovibrio marinus TaxID=2164132 RepID=UPI001E64DA60|nr:molybdopterin cofactor-binding domain-containing protein [Pleomorphovibrio marinus]
MKSSLSTGRHDEPVTHWDDYPLRDSMWQIKINYKHMKKQQDENHIFPEQYELFEKKIAGSPITRRSFFKRMGAGIASYLVVSDILAGPIAKSFTREAAEDTIGAWIHVNGEGRITCYTGKVEVGQNIRTSLAQVVAEELFVKVEDIQFIMGDTLLTPYDRGTFGSLTTPQMAPKLRKAAASVRELLKATAAKEWNTSSTSLQLEQGIVFHPSNGKRLSYAQLANGKKLAQRVNEDVQVVPVEDWKIAGTSVPKVNGKFYITGSHKYVSDLKLPDMQYGKVLRPPYLGAKLTSLDTSDAEKVQGVRVVKDGDFVGVTAPDSTTAKMALAMINAEWERKKQPSRKQLFSHLKENANKQPDKKPNVEEAFANGAKKVTSAFHVDYIAHTPLEPRAGLAEWKNGELNVWTGTQRPFGVQEELEKEFGLAKDKIRVRMPDTGSGYGGKHTGEAGIEAAKLAKAIGKPVKVNWTREEEFMWAYCRPAGLIEVRGALDANGKLAAWEMFNYNSGGAGIESPYDVPAKHQQFISSDTPLRQGSYRALASTANVFAIESVMNDLASEQGKDPMEFRMEHLSDERLRRVLKDTASKFGWEKEKRSDRGFGLACGFVKGGYVATCAEVYVDPETKEVKVLKLVTGFECGAILNPRHLKSQVLGCVLQGLGGALFEAVDFDNGQILNAAFSSYRVPRFKDIPETEVLLINRPDLPPAGAGEAPIIGVAPAIRNAIQDVTGERINKLPLVPSGKIRA